MNFLDLLNQVARKARPAHCAFAPVESMEDSFESTGLDSMDMLMVCIYMSEIYEVSEEKTREMQPKTPQEMLDYLLQHGTCTPVSIEQAMEKIA